MAAWGAITKWRRNFLVAITKIPLCQLFHLLHSQGFRGYFLLALCGASSGNCAVSGLVARLGRHILNHRFNSPLVRADASSPDFTGCSRIKTKKPATEVVGFFAIIAGSIWFTGDVFGGAGDLNPVRNYYTVGTTCLVQSLHSPASCGWTRY